MLILLAAGLASTLYCVIKLFFIIGMLRLRKTDHGENQMTVSVVVAARNEADNLPRCLEALRQQTHPAELTEVIVVNDRSTDATAQILKKQKKRVTNLVVLTIKTAPDDISPKKHALAAGIARAQGQIIFTTDADCVPPPEWIAHMLSLLDEETGVVIGTAPFFIQVGWLNGVLQLENLESTAISAGTGGWNRATTCTGRNLAYRKEVFQQVNGFAATRHTLSGDDDLFVQEVKKRTGWQLRFSLTAATAVPSASAANLREYVRQRRRHVSASKYYTRSAQLLYLGFEGSNLILFVALLSTLISEIHPKPIVVFFLLKLIFDFLSLWLVAKRLQRVKSLWYFPVWQVFHLLNQVLISPLGLVGRIKW